MDTSKKYILMCQKAEEIQKLWNVNEANSYYYNLTQKRICLTRPHCDGYGNSYLKIFLPRQDQLQEMAGCSWDEFYNGVLLGWCDCEEKPDSMEKACLLSIMFEKFNKVWNGTDWEEK